VLRGRIGQAERMRIGPWIAATMLLLPGCDDDSNSTGATSAQCHGDSSPTAGNHVIWFLGDVQQGRDPTIAGGVDDPFGCAYTQLCQARQDEITEAEFRASKGEVLSSLLTADTHAGSSPYVDRGVSEQHPALETLDEDLTRTWVEILATWYDHIDDRTIVSDSEREERWRINLVREDGQWRICNFTLTDS